MAAVKQQVLNWLYSVLTSEYTDVNRTYNDVAQTLSHFSSLSPRTDVYTYEHGASALLLHLSGTIPVLFRGTTYRFPIEIWVPHRYPQEAPLVYVKPTEGMVVRPGQHVDPQGKVYHPYLVGWAEYWDKSNILDFLAILRDVFAKEPPLISRQQQSAPARPQPIAVAPPLPPPRPDMGRPISADRPMAVVLNNSDEARPPVLPPKPGNNAPARRDSTGPPLPPLPPQRNSQYGLPPSQNGQQYTPQRNSSLRFESAPASLPAPPLPPQTQRQHTLQQDSYTTSPVSPMTPPSEPARPQSYTQSYQQQPQFSPNQQYPQNRTPSYIPQQGPPPQWSHQQQYQTQQKLSPPPDLIDAPLDLPDPNLPPPPVPINPEVGLLLQKLGSALHSQRQQTSAQASSSLPGLQSQHQAMLGSLSKMQSEIQALESLSGLLSSNADILHNSLREADAVIDSGKHRQAPNIDEILVAPTVVGNQLYELVSEERSLGDALFVLGRAVERGRISPAVFTKMTRSLAREWYLKKALAKKIGKGMGLTVS